MSNQTSVKTGSNVLFILRLSLTLLIITSVVAAALAGVNAITAPIIRENEAAKTQEAIREVLPGGYDREITDYTDSTGTVEAVYAGANGYAVQVSPMGFGGQIRMMVGIDREGNVLGISIISHTETAGLGAVAGADNAKGQAFRAQFIGLSGTLAVRKDGGTVDSITGATITSRAVTEGVNAALEWVRTFEKEVVA